MYSYKIQIIAAVGVSIHYIYNREYKEENWKHKNLFPVYSIV